MCVVNDVVLYVILMYVVCVFVDVIEIDSVISMMFDDDFESEFFEFNDV